MSEKIPKVHAPLNSQGLHRVRCPSCQNEGIDSFMMAVTREFDPNTKLCRKCGYAWRQVKS